MNDDSKPRNVRRDLYIEKYGSEVAADARLAEEARQDAARDVDIRRRVLDARFHRTMSFLGEDARTRDAQGIECQWKDATQAGPTPKPVQRQAAQEAAVLAKLGELRFDSKALPPAPAGKSSPAKQAVRAALPYSPDVMNKAWQRLLRAGAIKYA